MVIFVSKHNLQEYKFAKDVVDEFPTILAKLNRIEKELTEHKKFMVAGYVLHAIHESKEMLNRQYVHYKGVLEKKGKE